MGNRIVTIQIPDGMSEEDAERFIKGALAYRLADAVDQFEWGDSTVVSEQDQPAGILAAEA